MERPDPEQQRRWLSTAVRPIEILLVRVVPPRPDDAWRLDHPYVAAPDLPTATLWANLPTLLELGRLGAHPNQIAKRIQLAPHELLAAIVTSMLVDQYHIARTGNTVTITTTGATPSYTFERERVDHVAAELANRYDPHRLTVTATLDQPPTYDLYRTPPLPRQPWPLDSKYARGVWGQYLGHNANKLLGIIARELREPEPELAVRPLARSLHITPARVHAELDHLHHHGIIDLDNHHGTIATSGRIGPPARDILAAHPLIAISHRSLTRTGQAPARDHGLDI